MSTLSIVTWRIRDGQIGNVTATIRGGRWESDDPELVRLLGNIRLPTLHYYPDRHLELAHKAVFLLGGEVRDNRLRLPPQEEHCDVVF